MLVTGRKRAPLPPEVLRDNNLHVVKDVSRKCLDTTETNNYQKVISKNKMLSYG